MKQLYKSGTTVLMTVLISLTLSTETFAFDCPPQGDQVTYGTNNVWIGYVYEGTNFNTYKGYVQQGNSSSPHFDQGFGGDAVMYGTNGCDVYTQGFSVRYKLSKNFTNGYYDITVGGDDGYRLSVDGGATWIINRWNDQSYTTTTHTVHLSGTHDLVLEYYENGGQNRISFSTAPGCVPSGDPAVPGINNVWRGYLYQGNNFNTYRGFVTEGTLLNPNFDQSFGGSNTTYNTSSCGVQTENFSARYRLTMNLSSATYVFTVGADDGYRLSVDGGNNWIINNWAPHSYTSSTLGVHLSGTVNLVLEFFENGGDNRITFAMSSNSTLPVKLTSFTARTVAPDKVQLNWKVSEEVNFNHYIIERSTGTSAYTNVATVAGQNTDVHTLTAYTYTDQVTYNGLVHYRLKMVDKDGTAKYSSVVTVSLNIADAGVKIFPTIIENGSLYVETAGGWENGKVEVVDMNGRIMETQNLTIGGRQQVLLGKRHLAAGSYFVRVMDGNKLVSGKMVMVK